MGFDIECIIDILSYPGEYFCPVCRTLVYPNEAIQAQCTHLYCKPCLAHIANGSRACPYDGYLVTESDSKPLMESDKALAEKIGKVKVHCLYFRSGCTWEGILSDCASHGSGCSFGNSPVICNRCGIQLVHRQVHDHAQICPGVFDGQQTVAGASGLNKSGTTSTVTAVVNQTVAQSATSVSQAQNPPNVASALPGQNPNGQVNVNSHTPVVAPVAMAATDQWYQQQYQQYYQQYVGYDPYNQQQQYYPHQQQPIQQYQQHQVQVQGQQQSHAYPQTPVQAQPQVQHQPQPQSQPQGQIQQHQPQPQSQPVQQQNPVPQAPQQAQTQPQPQLQPQSQFQMLPQSQPQTQLPPQPQAQPQVPVQALAPNYQVNPQHPLHPTMRPQTQVPPQVVPPPPPPPHGQSTQPPQYPQGVGMRPPAQHPQPQYQQPHVHMHHSQAPQAHVQPHPPAHPFPQSSNQSTVQTQPQAQPYQLQSQPPIFHPQANQSGLPATVLQAPHPPAAPVSGQHSYQQPLPAQKMQSGAPQQLPMPPHMASGSLHPVQAHGQVPQQPVPMRPPQTHVSISQQQPSTLFPPQSQVPSIPLAPNQQFPPQGQQPTYPIQHRPLMQPVQQVLPQNYAQQQQVLAPFQGQMHQQGHLHLQQPMQSQMQMRPSGPPRQQQPQNYIGTPMIPNQGTHPQSHPLSYGGFGPPAPTGPAQQDSTKTAVNQNYIKLTEQNATVQEIKSPSKGLADKGFEGEALKEEGGTGQNGTVLKDSEAAAEDGLIKTVIKQEMGDVKGVIEQTSGKKSSEAGCTEDKLCKEEVHSLTENQVKLSNTAVAGQSSANYDRQPLSARPDSTKEGPPLPPKSHGTHQERSQAQVECQPSSIGGPQGPAALPHHGQSLNPTEGKASSNFGGHPRSFESPFGSQGSEMTSLADQRGTIGRASHIQGHYVSQHVSRPSEVTTPRDQVSGSGEGGPLVKPHADDPNFLRVNGGTAPGGSVFGSRNENLKHFSSREQLSFFPGEPNQPLDQASRPFDKPSHGPNYEAGSKLDPGALVPHSRFLQHRPSGGHSHGDAFGPGPEFMQHHVNPFSYQSSTGDYPGSPPRGFGGPSSFPRGSSSLDEFNSREAHRFGEGSRSFHFPSDPVGNSFQDGGFPPVPGHLRRGDIDGPVNPRFGEHRPPSLTHNQIGSDDVFRPEGSSHLVREKFSGPGYLSGHFNMGEAAGPGTFVGLGRAGAAANFAHPPFSDSGRSDVHGFPPFGEPAMRNKYPFHGFPSAGNFAGGVDSFDQSRKRKPPSTGWCRICEFDCDTVEGLEMHSQTREHQNMAIDMVKSIKRQNKKKHRAGHVHEGGSRNRKVGAAGRGSKA